MSPVTAEPVFKGRFFKATDPFGRAWNVEFRWLQTGISIRHADTVDVRFELSGPETLEKVVALPHPMLLELSQRTGRAVTDPWCQRIATAHLKQMIEGWGDMDKVLVTLTMAELEQAAGVVR